MAWAKNNKTCNMSFWSAEPGNPIFEQSFKEAHISLFKKAETVRFRVFPKICRACQNHEILHIAFFSAPVRSQKKPCQNLEDFLFSLISKKMDQKLKKNKIFRIRRN